MKLIELLNAYIPLKALTDLRFRSFKKARELSTLRKKVEVEVDFYTQEEKKIVETYAVKNEKGEPILLDGGRIKLDSIENKIKFEKEINDLRNLEVSNVGKVSLSEEDFLDIDKLPTPNEILALEAIIDFKEE